MALSTCISLSNESSPVNIDETGTHGTKEFPVAIYHDDVTKNIVNWHWHTEIEIGYIVSGSILVECGNRKYRLSEGDLFFVGSDVLHAMSNLAPGKEAIFHSLVFDGSVVGGSKESVFYQRYLLPVLENASLRERIWTEADADHHFLSALMRNAWTLVQNEPKDYEIDVRNHLSTLFSYLSHISDTSNLGATLDLTVEKRVQRILNYIHLHFAEHITLNDLSSASFISKSEVLRSFKSLIGISPIKYLKNYRLQKSAYLLRKSDLPLKEIYERCGFDDNSYFSKSFKEIYHCSPREFRNRGN